MNVRFPKGYHDKVSHLRHQKQLREEENAVYEQYCELRKYEQAGHPPRSARKAKGAKSGSLQSLASSALARSIVSELDHSSSFWCDYNADVDMLRESIKKERETKTLLAKEKELRYYEQDLSPVKMYHPSEIVEILRHANDCSASRQFRGDHPLSSDGVKEKECGDSTLPNLSISLIEKSSPEREREFLEEKRAHSASFSAYLLRLRRRRTGTQGGSRSKSTSKTNRSRSVNENGSSLSDTGNEKSVILKREQQEQQDQQKLHVQHLHFGSPVKSDKSDGKRRRRRKGMYDTNTSSRVRFEDEQRTLQEQFEQSIFQAEYSALPPPPMGLIEVPEGFDVRDYY